MKNQSHPKHKLALAAVQNTRNRQAENDLKSKEATIGELSTKTVKAATQVKNATGCIDTWVEVMRLHLEQDNLNDERQACTATLSNLEGTAQNCAVAKKGEDRDTADKVFEILLKRFGSVMRGHQAMMRFGKKVRGTTSHSIDFWMILRA